MLSSCLNLVSRSEIGTLVCKDTDGRFEGSLLTRYRDPGDMAASQARLGATQVVTSGHTVPGPSRGGSVASVPGCLHTASPVTAQIRDELLSPGPGPSTIITKLLIRVWGQELSSSSGLAQSSRVVGDNRLDCVLASDSLFTACIHDLGLPRHGGLSSGIQTSGHSTPRHNCKLAIN